MSLCRYGCELVYESRDIQIASSVWCMMLGMSPLFVCFSFLASTFWRSPNVCIICMSSSVELCDATIVYTDMHEHRIIINNEMRGNHIIVIATKRKIYDFFLHFSSFFFCFVCFYKNATEYTEIKREILIFCCVASIHFKTNVESAYNHLDWLNSERIAFIVAYCTNR